LRALDYNKATPRSCRTRCHFFPRGNPAARKEEHARPAGCSDRPAVRRKTIETDR